MWRGVNGGGNGGGERTSRRLAARPDMPRQQNLPDFCYHGVQMVGKRNGGGGEGELLTADPVYLSSFTVFVVRWTGTLLLCIFVVLGFGGL